MKFKVGDKVRVKKDLVGGTIYDKLYFGFCMEDFRGKEFIIKEIRKNGCYYILLNDGKGYAYNEAMLEFADDDSVSEKIIIYRKNNKTIAKYYKGNKTVTAEFKCLPEDELDFETGAKLTMNRAIEKMKEKEVG